MVTGDKFVNSGIRITEQQKRKLQVIAKQLGKTANATIGELIDNATIEPVMRNEAVAKLRRV